MVLVLMLVYAKEPMGYTTVDGKRVYGENFNYGRFGPTEISYESFRRYRDVLKEVPMTAAWLATRFGVPFPDICLSFVDTFQHMTFDELVDVAKLIGLRYVKSRKPSKAEKRALRRSVIRVIDNHESTK